MRYHGRDHGRDYMDVHLLENDTKLKLLNERTLGFGIDFTRIAHKVSILSRYVTSRKFPLQSRSLAIFTPSQRGQSQLSSLSLSATAPLYLGRLLISSDFQYSFLWGPKSYLRQGLSSLSSTTSPHLKTLSPTMRPPGRKRRLG